MEATDSAWCLVYSVRVVLGLGKGLGVKSCMFLIIISGTRRERVLRKGAGSRIDKSGHV